MPASPQLFGPSRATPCEATDASTIALGATVIWHPDDTPCGPAQKWTVPGGWIFGWDARRVRTELALFEAHPVLPKGMSVTGSLVGVWRLRSEKRCATPKLTCRLSSVPDPISGGPDSGQYLDATTWDSADSRWTIGTQDADALYERSIADDRLPTEWAKTFRRVVEPTSPTGGEYPVAHLRGGLQIRLPDLPAHTTAEVQQAAAWREAPSPDDDSTWRAIDLGRDWRTTGDL